MGRRRSIVKNLIHFLCFALLSLALGLGSAYYSIEHGFALVAPHTGPWKTWINAGSLAADPYTRARIARIGDLPITSASGLTFVATTDSEGEELSSGCDYEIVARPTWSPTRPAAMPSTARTSPCCRTARSASFCRRRRVPATGCPRARTMTFGWCCA
jgi:hypothetical protein